MWVWFRDLGLGGLQARGNHASPQHYQSNNKQGPFRPELSNRTEIHPVGVLILIDCHPAKPIEIENLKISYNQMRIPEGAADRRFLTSLFGTWKEIVSPTLTNYRYIYSISIHWHDMYIPVQISRISSLYSSHTYISDSLIDISQIYNSQILTHERSLEKVIIEKFYIIVII